MALVYIRPDADSVDGNWLNESGNNTNLYDSLNEVGSPVHADYIRSEDTPANDIVKLRLSNFGVPVIEPMTVRYRFQKVVLGAATLSLKVRLVEGSTTIAEWEHSDVSETHTDGEQVLTTAQFDSIVDFDDLYLEFEAITGALVLVGATLLLTDEPDGFSIDATNYNTVTTEAYEGGPVGGTVSLKESGVLSDDNVALDNSILSQDGTSPKMVHWNEAPFVRWTPHNLGVQSGDFEDSGVWEAVNTTLTGGQPDPSGGTTAVLMEQGGDNSSFRYQIGMSGIDVVAGFLYTTSVYWKDNADTVAIRFFGYGGAGNTWFIVNTPSAPTIGATDTGYVSSSVEDAGDGWYRLSVTRLMATDETDALAGAWCTDADGSTLEQADSYYMWGFQVNRGPIATPYLATTTASRIGIPQTYDGYEDCFGILIEPAATNLLVQSEDIGTTWVNENSTGSTNAGIAPDGSATADELIEASDTAQIHDVYQSCSITSGTAYTLSCYAKAGTTRTWFELGYDNTTFPGSSNCFFDLANGVRGTEGAGVDDSKIESVGDGWYRCSITATATSTAANLQYLVIASADGVDTYNGNGTGSLFLWGAQLETGSVATSYIPTVTTTAPRAMDEIEVTLADIPCYSAVKGTMYTDAARRMEVNAYANPPRTYMFHDGTLNDTIELVGESGGEHVEIIDGGTPQAALDTYAVDPGGNVRAQSTVAWAANDFDASGGGGSVDSDGSGTVPTLTDLKLGNRLGNDRPMNGTLFRLVYVPRQVQTEG